MALPHPGGSQYAPTAIVVQAKESFSLKASQTRQPGKSRRDLVELAIVT